MLSISYIIGQMNGLLSQIIAFVRSVQDAKISLHRLSEIHNKPNEEVNEEQNVGKMTHLFDDKPGGKMAWYSPKNLLGEELLNDYQEKDTNADIIDDPEWEAVRERARVVSDRWDAEVGQCS